MDCFLRNAFKEYSSIEGNLNNIKLMKKIVLLSSLVVMNLLCVGCDLGDESSCPEPLTGELSAAESVLVGSWVLTDMVADEEIDLTDDGVENPSTEIFQQLSECKQDVVYTFVSDRTFNVKQSYNVPNCETKGIVEGTWKATASQLTTVAQCESLTKIIDMNTEQTIFTTESNFQFNDVYGFYINSTVTLTYEKVIL
jgi:hypothetical protein